jgi:homoserine O-acetyltransferase
MKTQAIGDLTLSRGGVLHDVQIGYESLGSCNATRDNVILVLHGYTSGPDMILPGGEPAEGSWRDLIGPGLAIDTDRYFVLCPNALGSTYGSTGAGSIDPRTGRPYGSAFPTITMHDVVASQGRLLDALGIERLLAVLGPSFGGCQAFQWAVDQPGRMKGVIPALAALGPPPGSVEQIRIALAKDANWEGGDFQDGRAMLGTLVPLRVAMLKSYGIGDVLAKTIADPAEIEAELVRRARAWAEGFDARALITIQELGASYDVTPDLNRIRAKLLYVLCRTDPLFPPALAEDAMARMRSAGVDARYFEIDSDKGHGGSSADAALWAPVLRQFIDELGT